MELVLDESNEKTLKCVLNVTTNINMGQGIAKLQITEHLKIKK